MMSLEATKLLATALHSGQVDKAGVDYIEHPLSVAGALEPFGFVMQKAGLLHDVLEDCMLHVSLTSRIDTLWNLGVPYEVISLVIDVTNVPERDESYFDKIRAITESEVTLGDLGYRDSPSRAVAVLKLADNLDNSRRDRLSHLPQQDRDRLELKYLKARGVLRGVVEPEDYGVLVAFFSGQGLNLAL